jgi:hypothetical protein
MFGLALRALVASFQFLCPQHWYILVKCLPVDSSENNFY